MKFSTSTRKAARTLFTLEKKNWWIEEVATGNFSPKVQNKIKKEITVSELNLIILTFSSGKLSFKLTIAAENSAYRRII